MPNGQPAQLANLRPRRWNPGESGNARGKRQSHRECMRLARKAAPDAMRVVIELMHDPEVPPAVRLAASSCVLDRALGKASTHVEAGDETAIPALRIEFVQANGSNDQRTIDDDSNLRVIEAIEFGSQQNDDREKQE